VIAINGKAYRKSLFVGQGLSQKKRGLMELEMNFCRLSAGLGFFLGGAIVLSQTRAQAFTFQTNIASDANNPKGDIILDSVKIESTGEVIRNFTLVNGANIISNEVYTGGNTGAASVDVGDQASGQAYEDPTSEQISNVLSNLNLNNIIDTEDGGNFAIDISFEQAVDNLFVWERGKNSDLKIQGLDATGQLIGNLFQINRRDWASAGYSIDTTEIGSAQQVGSLGISMADLGVSGPIMGFRLYSEARFNGPDWKILGSVADRNVASTPEPSGMIGLGLLTGGLAFYRRQKKVAVA
jgi:hypothetical protein